MNKVTSTNATEIKANRMEAKNLGLKVRLRYHRPKTKPAYFSLTIS